VRYFDLSGKQLRQLGDVGGDCACDGAFLVERIAAHHQSADRAAAETQYRESCIPVRPNTRISIAFLHLQGLGHITSPRPTPSKLLTYPPIWRRFPHGLQDQPARTLPIGAAASRLASSFAAGAAAGV
jgi:hypothetical protein